MFNYIKNKLIEIFSLYYFAMFPIEYNILRYDYKKYHINYGKY